jgi:leucyl aminopeptidase
MNMTNVITPFIKFNFQTAQSAPKGFDGFVYIFSSDKFLKFKANIQKIVEFHAHSSQQKTIFGSEKKSVHFMGIFGPVWILFANEVQNADSQGGYFTESIYGWARDQAGGLVSQYKTLKVKNISVDFGSLPSEAVRGFIVGSEMSAYNYLQVIQGKIEKNIEISLKTSMKINSDLIWDSQKTAMATNLARHLVNLPPNELNPSTIQTLIQKELKFSKSSSIEVWDYEKCKKENMNLLVAVGKGSKDKPKMIRIKYRPGKSSKNKKPIAFVGKGITFDTGGLDIKPSNGMRLMKKDMGGSAAVLGLAVWVDAVKYNRACDFYLALAENSVDADAMRPSDVYKSRSGHLVEIDNTDAEGRLVLADVIDVAVTQTEMPEYLIDLATLTGAIKVALGADIAGLFCNNEKLAAQILSAGQLSTEPNWRMPLVQKYATSLNSNFADFKNSADGFGGAITAALFLEKFVRGMKWAHLDIYSWTDKSTGALTAGSANGQPVQSLIAWLKLVE